nr:phosphotransferase [Kribbella sandramycini]
MSGGRLTPGVVRDGETVRRPTPPGTAELLDLLAARGFKGAPRYVAPGVLTYVEGSVPARFQIWSDSQIADFGVLLRAFHEATRGSALAAPHEVVCHHDLGPNNTVFRDDRPVALIDFDLAAPGSPLEDFGYAAWTWCIASKYDDVDRQAAQVALLADSYQLTPAQRSVVVDAVLERLSRNSRFWAETTAPVTSAQRAEYIAWSRREHAFVGMHRAVFEQALRGGRLF